MRLLLDTHALIWWWDGDPSLSAVALAGLTDPGASVFVSAVVGWEIATKVRAGKLPQMADKIGGYDHHVFADGFTHLAVSQHHAVRAGLMPGDHRDPFDRIQAAQALIEDLTVVTRDSAFATFGCKVLW